MLVSMPGGLGGHDQAAAIFSDLFAKDLNPLLDETRVYPYFTEQG